MNITTTFQQDVVAVQTETDLHLLIEMTAPASTNADAWPPMRLSLAIDRSGSMGRGKLEAARVAATFLVDRLQDDDQLAIVAYDNEVQLVAPLMPLDRPALRHAISGITTGGMTNLSGGWLKAAEELGRDPDATGVRRVLVLSDGHANEGITDATQLRQISANLASQGITTTTVGFGDGFDEDLMTGLADEGRGGAHFAALTEDLPGIFANEFEDLVSLAAQNVSVELQLSDAVEVVEVLNTHPVVPVPGGLQVQVGDAYAGATIRLVCRLRIPALPVLGLATVGDAVVRWVSIEDGKVAAHTTTTPLVVNAVSSDEAAGTDDNPHVTEEVTILLAGRRANEARRLAEEGNVDEAISLARQTAAELRELREDHPAAASMLATAERLERTAHSMEIGGFSSASSKTLHYEAREMSRRKRDNR